MGESSGVGEWGRHLRIGFHHFLHLRIVDEASQRQNKASIDEIMGSLIGSLTMAVGALPYPWGRGPSREPLPMLFCMQAPLEIDDTTIATNVVNMSLRP